MKILFLTPQLPNPPHKGTTIRNFNLIKQLSRRHEVHLLSFIRSEDDQPWVDELRKYCRGVETVIAPEHHMWRRLLTFFFSPLPDMAVRLPSAEFQARLEAYLERENFDIVQVEGIEMAPYALAIKGFGLAATFLTGLGLYASGVTFPALARCKVVFDDHNAEYVLQQRAFETDRRYPGRWLKAAYSLVQRHKLRRYETTVCHAADHVVAVSETDRVALLRITPGVAVTVVPNGVDSAYFSSLALPESYSIPQSKIRHLASLVFTGTLDFRPNIDAVVWFCEQVLPHIKKEIFHIHLYIVGKSPTREVRRLGEDAAVTVTGYVGDVRPYIAQSKIYVVPVRMGSGTKLKVLEAMAMGTPVVSTTLGAEGIAVTAGQDVLIADDPAEFAEQVVALMNDEPLRKSMSARGRALMESRYDWQVIVPTIEQMYASLFPAGPTAGGASAA
jgi:glycosyltransferase involved in cell wall biosynthesis